jgi:rare lipoprotein A
MSPANSHFKTVNERGPFVRGRIIDVSSGAGDVIGMKDAGVARVTLEVVSMHKLKPHLQWSTPLRSFADSL